MPGYSRSLCDLHSCGAWEGEQHLQDLFGIVGENFTFPVNIEKNPEEIVWTKNKDKVAEWEEQNTTYFSSFRDRSFLNEENGCLTIFNLQNSDAGVYELDYFITQKESSSLTFMLHVLPPPSEPEISCNDSGDTFVLKFPKPLYYTWKLNGIPPIVHHIPEVFIPKEDVGASTKAVYFIKFSQTEKSSEISLTQCLSGKKCNEPSMGYR
ncbi:LOW QUALITY PROTEIN: lymphocyte function-associated antigen 3 [Melopsittacus undulatus]|uniref:LOW QUALITY PROTEIN: lymphocyte function-associated antigen 3 n=1 Tax=Melopsittacus undulatus TaxID=13146 RepID=UPI00146B7C42|nr:LOW QUALITY PROTEIN: lymphocyte function-associated antigen 3 [Melopsittacus undulatus]